MNNGQNMHFGNQQKQIIQIWVTNEEQIDDKLKVVQDWINKEKIMLTQKMDQMESRVEEVVKAVEPTKFLNNEIK
jgi:hypothetical protein